VLVELTSQFKVCCNPFDGMNGLGASGAQRLEGSRFAGWQIYRLAAGGSRD